MNEKEVAELRRQFHPEKTNISRVRGCYVNEKSEIVSTFSQSLLKLTEEETESLLGIIKKTLSGSIGRNLNDIAFSNNQVLDSDEHRLLMTLRDTALEDDEAVNALYERIIASISMDTKYLILLAHEKYDVFSYSKDGHKEDDSASVFTYFVCCVCPIKQSKAALSFAAYNNSFCNIAANSIVGAPEIGFLFPAFDDRAANIYNALFYTRDTSANYADFVDHVFKTELPMPAGVQKETFQTVFSESVSEECDLDVVQAVQEQISDMIEIHKASRERDPLLISKNVISDVLRSCDVEEDRVETFSRRYDEAFGVGTEVPPQNIVDTKHFELQTPDVTVKVNPDRPDLVTTRIIDGVKYILIRADENVALNGVNIHIS